MAQQYQPFYCDILNMAQQYQPFYCDILKIANNLLNMLMVNYQDFTACK